ncbi:MAG: hypothetical protein WB947_07975 [Thermoplasmata archaeon]
MMVVFFAILYALGMMVLGNMLILVRISGGYSWEILWGNALGQAPWNYPGFYLVAPWGVVTLPFLATWSMILVSIGVGIGVSMSLLIAARLIRDRRAGAVRPGSVVSVAGLTPAMIALVTLGACCSVTAAATAGVGLVAQTSGSTVNNLLVNNWYLDVFQVAVVFVALVASEMVLEVYGGLFGLEPRGELTGVAAAQPPPLTRRVVAGAALRLTLLIAGVTWSLAGIAEWTTVSPTSASGAFWFQWIFQHQLLAGFAILAALFPGSMAAAFSRRPAGGPTFAVRVGLLVGGLSLAAWVPPALAAGGAPGFVNELFGVWGLPASWGAVAPIYSLGWALYLRWGIQYLFLGGFAVTAALFPRRTFAPIRWSIGIETVESAPTDGRAVRSTTEDELPGPHSPRGNHTVISDVAPRAQGVQDP